MSTKIYDGLQIKYMSMQNLNEYFKNLRKELIPIANEEYLKVLARIVECFVVYAQTNVQLNSPIKNYSVLKNNSKNEIRYQSEKVALEIMKSNKAAETIMEYESDLDFDVKISIFPINKKLLALPYVSNERLKKELLSKPEIMEYGYWNNVDRPENISSAAWKRRKNNWDKALPGLGIPSENGFLFEILDSKMHAFTFISDFKKLYPYFSSNDKLEKEVAFNMLLNKKYDEFKEITPPEELERNTMSIYFKARDYIKAHPEELEELKKTITIDIQSFLEN